MTGAYARSMYRAIGYNEENLKNLKLLLLTHLDIKFTDDYKNFVDNRIELFAKLYKVKP